MSPEKRKKCHELQNRLSSARLGLQENLRKMNLRDEEAKRLRSEIDRLESQAKNIVRSTSMNAIGLGDRKGRPLSVGGLMMDGIDGVKLANQIKDKISELSSVIRSQKDYQTFSESDDRAIEALQRRIDQMGCR